MIARRRDASPTGESTMLVRGDEAGRLERSRWHVGAFVVRVPRTPPSYFNGR